MMFRLSDSLSNHSPNHLRIGDPLLQCLDLFEDSCFEGFNFFHGFLSNSLCNTGLKFSLGKFVLNGTDACLYIRNHRHHLVHLVQNVGLSRKPVRRLFFHLNLLVF